MNSPTTASFTGAGLNFQDDDFSAEERDSLLSWYRENHDYGDLDLAAFSRFQLHHDPGGFKRLRRYIFTLDEPSSEGDGLPIAVALLCYVHSYTVEAYGEGVFYETIALRNLGARKREVLAAIRLGALASGPKGMNPLGRTMLDYLESWSGDEGAGISWPGDWKTPASGLRSGIDLASDDVLEGESDLILSWHERMYGAVPVHVEKLLADRPRVVKANQARFEIILDDALPAQAVPVLRLHTAVIARDAHAIKRAVHMAKAIGVTRRHAVDAILWAAVHGGDESIEMAFISAGETLSMLPGGRSSENAGDAP